jgi:hypothetical protein
MAAVRGHQEIVTLLLISGARVNKKDRNANTPLHFAVLQNHLDIVSLLRAYGADNAIRNHQGETPLNLALGKPILNERLNDSKYQAEQRVQTIINATHQKLLPQDCVRYTRDRQYGRSAKELVKRKTWPKPAAADNGDVAMREAPQESRKRKGDDLDNARKRHEFL